MIFPITTKKFWFVNAYLALYLVSPFLNKLIHSLTKRQFEYLLLVLLVIFPIRLTFLPLTWSQDASGGMSVILFLVLYCIAAWLRLYYRPKNPKPIKYLLCYVGTALFLVCSKWILLKMIPEAYTTKLYGYISIFTIFEAVSLFLFFLYRKPVTGRAEKIILNVAPHSFTVYIIHFSMLGVLFTKLMHVDQYIAVAYIGLPAVIISCIFVFAVSILIDMIRSSIVVKVGQVLREKGKLQLFDKPLSVWDKIADI